MLGVAITAFVIFVFPKNNKKIIIGFPDRDGETDLFVVDLGSDEKEGVRIARDASASFTGITVFGGAQPVEWFDLAGFVPNNDLIYLLYSDDGDLKVGQFSLGDEEAEEVLGIDSVDQANLYVDIETIIVSEDADENVRCYAAKINQEFSRIEKSDYCFPAPNGSLIFSVEEKDGLVSLKAISLDGEDEFDVFELSDDDGDIEHLEFSDDGHFVGYVIVDDAGEQTVNLVDVLSEDEETIKDEIYNVLSIGFLSDNTLYYIVELADGNLELYLGDENSPLEKAAHIFVDSSKDGTHLFYLIGDRLDDLSLYSYSFSDQRSEKIYQGKQVRFAVLDQFEKIFIVDDDDDEVTFLASDFDGENLVELFQDDDYEFGDLSYVDVSEKVFLRLTDEDNKNSVFITSLDEEDGFFLIEEWSEYQLLDISPHGSYLAFSGREDADDDMALFSTEISDDSRVKELDDDLENITNAVFSPDGKNIIYTAVVGSDADDVDVMQVDRTRENRPEQLYRGAELVDVFWSNMDPFQYADLGNVISGTSMCPGAPLLELDATLTGRIEDSGSPICLRVEIEEDSFLSFEINDLDATQNDDISATIYSRDGDDVLTNRSVDSRLPLILPYYFETSGVFYIQIEREDADDNEISIELTEAENPFMIAESISVDSTISGALTSSSLILLPDGTYLFGELYEIVAQENDMIQVNLVSDDMDSFMYVFDIDQNILTTNDDGGSGLNSKISFVAEEGEVYYILASKLDSSSPEGEIEYELTVDVIRDSFSKASFLPTNRLQRGAITSSDTLSGSSVDFPESRGDMYYFDAEDGQQITISVDARAIGSGLDPHIYLYDSNYNRIDSDDDSGPGYDSRITYTIPRTARYYLLVTSHSGSYGSSSNYFYDITLDD